jgi:integrase
MAVRQRLTKRVVESLVPRQGTSVLVFDSEVKGFAVRVRWGRGRDRRVWRTYVFRYQEGYGRKASRDRWLRIGEHGEPWVHAQTGRAQALTAEAARAMALWLRGIRNGGGDPRAALRPAEAAAAPASAPTLRAFVPEYLEKHADVRKVLDSAREDRRLLDNHILPALGDTPVDRITRAQVEDFHLAMKATPTNANRVLSLLSTILNVARRRGVVPENHANPCRDVRKFKERKRDRYLSPTELVAIGDALAAEEARRPHAVAAVRVLALTGARPIEMLSLKREQLHLELAHVMVMRKGKHLPVYLPRPAIEILEALPAKAGNPHVFVGFQTAHHVSLRTLEDLWARVRVAAGCPDVRLYDLRHTFASIAVQGGASLPMIGGLLGHVRPETTQRYAHLADSPIRKLGKKTAATIAKALKGAR